MMRSRETNNERAAVDAWLSLFFFINICTKFNSLAMTLVEKSTTRRCKCDNDSIGFSSARNERKNVNENDRKTKWFRFNEWSSWHFFIFIHIL